MRLIMYPVFIGALWGHVLSAWMDDSHPLLKELNARVSELTRLETQITHTHSHSENFQVRAQARCMPYTSCF